MAAKTRAELRDLVRTQLDVDATELPDATIDAWLEDGYERTLSVEERWPFLEHQWTFTTTGTLAQSKAALAVADPDGYQIDRIVSVLDLTEPSSPIPLQPLPHARAEAAFGDGLNGGGVPAWWSEWGGDIYMWEAPDAGRTVKVRGYRKGAWAAGDTVEVDADERLHFALYFFAVAQAYAQQEDEVLSAKYMQDWMDAVQRAHKAIVSEVQRSPIVMSGSGVNWVRTPVRLVP